MMNRVLPFAALALVALPAAALAQPNGEALFTERCAVCHGASAPPKETLAATHNQDQIVEVLTTGAMAPMAGGLSAEDKKAIAAYLVPASAAAPAAAAPATNAPAPATNAPAPATNAPASPQ